MTLKRLGHAQFCEYLKQIKTDLTASQIEALFIIKKRGPLSFKDLAQQLMLQPASVTQLFDALSGFGYVDRKVCEDDRRASNISITDKGIEFLRAFEPYIEQRQSLIAQALTEEEAQELNRLHHKLIAYMQAQHKKIKE